MKQQLTGKGGGTSMVFGRISGVVQASEINPEEPAPAFSKLKRVRPSSKSDAVQRAGFGM